MAHALSESSARVLVLERGDFVPQEEENWNPEAVWKDLRYRTSEHWLDGRGREFRPYTHYCVGGNTKFWGSVLFRLRREDFQAIEHADGISPAWPIDYDTLAPLLRSRRTPLLGSRTARSRSDRGAPRPVSARAGAARGTDGGDRRAASGRRGCTRFPFRSGFATTACSAARATRSRASCTRRAMPTCARCGPASERPNVTLWTNALARRLFTDSAGKTITAVEVERNGATQRVEGAAVHRGVRRGEFGGAAVAVRE